VAVVVADSFMAHLIEFQHGFLCGMEENFTFPNDTSFIVFMLPAPVWSSNLHKESNL